MPVYIPAAQLYQLEQMIFQHTSASLSGALSIAESIGWMVRGAAEEAVAQSRSELISIDGQIRADVNAAIGGIEGTLWQMDASIRAEVNNSLGILTEIVSGIDNTVSQEATENMTKAYDAIAESQSTAGKVIDEVIMTTGEWLGKTYDKVGQMVHQELDSVFGVVVNTIDNILQIPEALIGLAIDKLIPAEIQAMGGFIEDILTGKGIESLLRLWARRMGEEISEVFSFDEKEVKEWTSKITNMLKDQIITDMG